MPNVPGGGVAGAGPATHMTLGLGCAAATQFEQHVVSAVLTSTRSTTAGVAGSTDRDADASAGTGAGAGAGAGAAGDRTEEQALTQLEATLGVLAAPFHVPELGSAATGQASNQNAPQHTAGAGVGAGAGTACSTVPLSQPVPAPIAKLRGALALLQDVAKPSYNALYHALLKSARKVRRQGPCAL